MIRLARYTFIFIAVFATALILAACGGNGGDSKPEQIVAETIQPTDTPGPSPLPPTWTSVPTDTPAPPPPTVEVPTRPTNTPFAAVVATPLIQETDSETGGPASTPPETSPGTPVEPDSTQIADEGSPIDLAPISAANAMRLVLITARDNVSATDIAWSANGNRVAAAMPDGVRLFDSADFNREPRLLPDGGDMDGFRVQAVAFSPDGSHLASANTVGELVIWDMTTYERFITIQADNYILWDLIYSPDGTQIVTCSDRGWIKVWNAASGELDREIETDGAVYGLAAYPLSGLVVASGASTNRAKIWNLATGEELATITGHSSEVRAVAFGPDGETLASGGDEGSVRIWTVAGAQEGEPDAILGGHSNMISALAHSPDSTLMAVGVSDGSLAIWDLATREKLFETQAHVPWVSAILWSPDGTALITTGRDGTLRIWGVPVAGES